MSTETQTLLLRLKSAIGKKATEVRDESSEKPLGSVDGIMLISRAHGLLDAVEIIDEYTSQPGRTIPEYESIPLERGE